MARSDWSSSRTERVGGNVKSRYSLLLLLFTVSRFGGKLRFFHGFSSVFAIKVRREAWVFCAIRV